jgi:hypothetical protein
MMGTEDEEMSDAERPPSPLRATTAKLKGKNKEEAVENNGRATSENLPW